MLMDPIACTYTYPKRLAIHWVSTTESPEFALFSWALTRSSVVALDAEWKPPVFTHQNETEQRTFPNVSILQLACRLVPDSAQDDSLVFLLDLQTVPLGSVYGQLKQMLVSPNMLKLGFRFKQDLTYLSSTFCAHGFEPGFDAVEPYIDISSVHSLLQQRQSGRNISKNAKSLAAICEELLGVSLSKELQCSDWSQRPLTEEQKMYAAMDAHCLLEIFSIFQHNIDKKGGSENGVDMLQHPGSDIDPKAVLEKPATGVQMISSSVPEAAAFVRRTSTELLEKETPSIDIVGSGSLCNQTVVALDGSVSETISKYGSKILLKESDKRPRPSRRRKKQPTRAPNLKAKGTDCVDDWQGPAPWDLLHGGDGCPKFLCDAMIEGLAKYLRCVGIDAAVPYSKKPENRELIEHARREKRVLLTRDAKLLRHEYLIENQIYIVKNLLKDRQLNEVITTFHLKISEDQIMSRCTKCNGRFIQRPLTTEEAIEAAEGFQKLPNCVLTKNLEFWQCMDCKQLYWEGTQYDSAKQRFRNFCDLTRNSNAFPS